MFDEYSLDKSKSIPSTQTLLESVKKSKKTKMKILSPELSKYPELTNSEVSTELYQPLDPFDEDVSKLVSLSISTIMLMASNQPIPADFLDITHAYLLNMQNSKGKLPPNIKGMVKIINVLQHRFAAM